MFVVLATNSNLNVKVTGPFNSERTAQRYARDMEAAEPIGGSWSYLALPVDPPLTREEVQERRQDQKASNIK